MEFFVVVNKIMNTFARLGLPNPSIFSQGLAGLINPARAAIV
jgi:hypothetical protein